MKLVIELPDYEDDGIDVIWHEGSCVQVDVRDHSVYVLANEN